MHSPQESGLIQYLLHLRIWFVSLQITTIKNDLVSLWAKKIKKMGDSHFFYTFAV